MWFSRFTRTWSWTLIEFPLQSWFSSERWRMFHGHLPGSLLNGQECSVAAWFSGGLRGTHPGPLGNGRWEQVSLTPHPRCAVGSTPNTAQIGPNTRTISRDLIATFHNNANRDLKKLRKKWQQGQKHDEGKYPPNLLSYTLFEQVAKTFARRSGFRSWSRGRPLWGPFSTSKLV